MKLSHYLGDKPFWQVTSRLALPIALQNVLTSSFTLVDTMMVSRLGDVTLSAVGMAGQWGWLFNLINFGLCSGMSVFVSQYWGTRDLKGIRRVLGMALLNSLVLALTFLSAASLAPELVIGMFNQDPQVLEVGCRYLRIVCWSYPAMALSFMMATLLRNTERVTLPMYVSFFTAMLNAVVNYGLIFGKLGMPELGAAGAAVATCISAWASPVLLFMFSLRERNLLIGPLKELAAFTRAQLGEFYRKALPAVFNEAMWAMGMLVLNMIFSNMGYEYYAGMTVFRTISDLCFAFYVGLGNACVIMVGKAVGQGKIARAIEDSLRFSILVPVVGLLVGLICIALRMPLISIFSAGDNLSAVTLRTAELVLIFCSVEILFRNVPYVQVVGVFRSGGDTTRGMIYDLTSVWLLAIPIAWVAANVLELPFLAVVMIAYLVEDVPKAIACIRYSISLKWLRPVTPEGREGLEAYKKTLCS